ncbi:MAG: hypothetical protein ACI35S_01075 [Anaeroplasma sp.]
MFEVLGGILVILFYILAILCAVSITIMGTIACVFIGGFAGIIIGIGNFFKALYEAITDL